jgi:hypothetical protein
MNDEYEQYLAYFEAQALGRGVGGTFKSIRLQKGNGIGSFLGGLFRKVLPYIKNGASALGNELLNTGVSLLRDHLKGADPRTSIKDRVKSAGTNLGDKASAKLQSMLGLGYIDTHDVNGIHSPASNRKRKTLRPPKLAKVKRLRRKKDIFDQ